MIISPSNLYRNGIYEYSVTRGPNYVNVCVPSTLSWCSGSTPVDSDLSYTDRSIRGTSVSSTVTSTFILPARGDRSNS